MKSKVFAFLASTGLAVSLVACSGGGGGIASTSAPTLSAVLNDAPVKGVCYLSQPSGLTGATDTSGTYSFASGDSVSFWIDVSGAGCSNTAATSASTTGIALGAVTPTGNGQQTFVLSFSAGPQVAEALQALNHGTAVAMDVSGITLPNTGSAVSNINTYIASAGTTQGTPTAVGTLFQNAQAIATVANAAIVPAIAINAGNAANFQTTVVNALATTVASGLGTAPSTITIPANRIVMTVTSGLATTTPSGGTASTAPFTEAHFTYFDGNGSGIKVRPTPASAAIAPFTAASLGTYEQLPFTYSVAGNVISRTTAMKSYLNTNIGTATDSTTVQYDDGHGAFFSGSSTKTYTVGSISGTVVNSTYSGSNVRLTPLTLSMLAGKTIQVAAPRCPNGVSTFSVDSTGTTSTNSDCGLEVATFAASNIPGILNRTSPTTVSTNNDGSVLYIGLDGPGVTAGSALVFVTNNCGPVGSSCNYPLWGRLQILSVK